MGPTRPHAHPLNSSAGRAPSASGLNVGLLSRKPHSSLTRSLFVKMCEQTKTCSQSFRLFSKHNFIFLHLANPRDERGLTAARYEIETKFLLCPLRMLMFASASGICLCLTSKEKTVLPLGHPMITTLSVRQQCLCVCTDILQKRVCACVCVSPLPLLKTK